MSLTIAATAITASSSIFSGIAKSNQDAYAAQVAGQNAQIAQRQAAITAQQGVDEQTTQYRKVAQTMGAQTAGFAAAGLDPTFGSAASTLTGTALLGEQDAQRLRNNNTNAQNGYLQEATNDLAQRSADKTAQGNDMFSGVLNAAGNIIGGASQISKFSAANTPSTKLT